VEASFEGWYQREHPRVIGVVFVACGDPDVAEDAADEAFTRALARWPQVEAMGSPAAWVCRVALNVMRRRLRRRAIERRLLSGRRPAEGPPGPAAYPEVWAAVRALPERQRLAVVLRYVADLGEADIASVMDVTRGTVAASLAAARSRLAATLAGFDFDSDPDAHHVEAPHG
jgi:DNA-directed RNA polymerase specialized sigma24 family protein